MLIEGKELIIYFSHFRHSIAQQAESISDVRVTRIYMRKNVNNQQQCVNLGKI